MTVRKGRERPPASAEPRRYDPIAMRLLTPAAAVLCALVAAPSLAHARPVVLYDAAEDAVSAATAAKEALGSGDFKVEGELASVVGPAGQVVAIGGELTACTKRKGPNVEGVLAESTAWVDQMEYKQAIKSVDRIASTLPCGGGSASQVELFQVWFLRGIAAFNDGDESTARAAFSKAAMIDPSRKWDEAFPPTPKPLYLEALQEVLSERPVALTVTAEGVALDGAPLTPGETITAQVGEHVLTQGGQVFTLLLDEAGGEVILTTPREVASAIVSRDDLGMAWLTRVTQERGWSEVLIVTGGEARRFKGGKWVTADEAGGTAVAAGGPPPMLIAGLATAGAGLGITVAGIGLNADAYSEAYDPDGNPLIDNIEKYNEVRSRSVGGTAMIVGGAVTLAAGAGITIVSLITGGKTLAVTPTGGVTRDRVVFGISGRF